jgi:hypothetical protein
MASMVATLGVLTTIRLVFTRFKSTISASDCGKLLKALEAVHWHARSFNEDQSMRSSLREKRFMLFANSPNRSPNLLEQEVDSAKHIIEIAMWMSCRQDESYRDAAGTWAREYASLVLLRFMDLDDTLASKHPLPGDIVSAYKPAVLMALRGMLISNNEDFGGFWVWMREHVPRLVLCHDREVRAALSDLFTKQLSL